MKKLIYMGAGLLLCLSFSLWTGCDKPNELDPDNGGGSGGDTTEDVRGGIEGVVTDKVAGELISMATVELLPSGKKTQTDDLGTFSFSDLKSGTYQLRVSKSGYEPYTSDDIAVKSGQTVRRAIVMEKELTDLRILDTADQVISVLDLGTMRHGVFKLKNTGSTIVEWEIPTLSEEWIGFSKQSGKLAPGASERIDLMIDRAKADWLWKGDEAVLYIGSTVGTLQLKVRVASDMVYVAGGTFMMGATEEQGDDAYNDEKPVHSVTLDGFYIGAFEVTQAQWKAVMGTNLSNWKGDDLPVENVSWSDAVSFCGKLSQMAGKEYRLPTEAEWEYAARGGQQAGGTKYAGSNNVGDVAWYTNNSGSKTHPVGQKQPNALGLYDMSGNVWEWCSDWYDSDYYSSSPSVNPQGPSGGSSRVNRGGGWYDDARYCRVSSRDYYTPGARYDDVGFLVVCER